MSPAAAYRYCRQIAISHYENFPVGSILIPKQLRKHFYSIYAFARIADDYADENLGPDQSPEKRLELLEDWRAMLVDCCGERATHPVFIALAETITRFSLPLSLFEDLLSAFSQDVTTRTYQTFPDLLDYCRRSANPIGRLILLMFGYHEESQLSRSDQICTALQLTNHWQDVSNDLDKGRVYLPVDDMSRFRLTPADLVRPERRDDFKALMAFEVDRVRELFAQGKSLCSEVRGRLGIELRAVWLGGTRILDLIGSNSYDVLSRRPRISLIDRIRILTLALNRRSFLD